jgi:hypothetical protein
MGAALPRKRVGLPPSGGVPPLHRGVPRKRVVPPLHRRRRGSCLPHDWFSQAAVSSANASALRPDALIGVYSRCGNESASAAG